jgi:hypothetical protein
MREREIMAKTPKAAKTWLDKLQAAAQPVVKPAPMDFAGMKAGQVMLIPTPRLIDEFVARVPAGKSMDVAAMRQALAKQQRAEVTCPVTTGFHLRVVAEAAYERHRLGIPLRDITPFWRVIDAKTPMTKKLACGAEFVRERRLAEGLEP